MPKFDVITFGGATQDIMYYTSDAKLLKHGKNLEEFLAFKYGSKISSEDVSFTFGGGGMNTAISFSLMGLKTSSIISLGDDWFASSIVKELKKNRINTDSLQIFTGIHSGFSFIVNYGNYHEHVLFTHRGANSVLNVTPKDLRGIDAKWFYIASLSGKDSLVEKNIKTILIYAKKKKIKVAWNPGVLQLERGSKYFKKYLKQIEFFNVNFEEARALCGSDSKKVNEIEILLETIYSWGPKIVSITCGHKGAYVYDGKEIIHEKILKVKSINTTGAGDAFGSSFVAGLILDYDIKKSLKLAMTRSCMVITKIGAQVGLLNKNQLTKFKI